MEKENSRLLTEEEMDEAWEEYKRMGLTQSKPWGDEVAKAQDVKTASIFEAKFVTEKAEFGLSVNKAAFKQGKAECQTRVERISKRIDDLIGTYLFEDADFLAFQAGVEALKKQERINIKPHYPSEDVEGF